MFESKTSQFRNEMAEAAPVVRMPSGFEEEFVNPVDEDFQCLICSLPLREPVLTRCGHRFCRQCLEEHLRRQQEGNLPLTCPVDRIEMIRERDIFPDKATERKILSFVIKCPSEGCEWTGELREKETHLKSCSFEIISCTSENCQVKVTRKDLEEHVITTCQWTIVQCSHCDEPHPKCQLQEHFLTCKRYPVDCPNSCSTVIPREEISPHTDTECPLTIISCPYDRMGCNKRMERRQMKSHVQSATGIHLDLACKKLDNTEEELKQTRNEMEEKINTIQTQHAELEAKLNTIQTELKRKTNLNELEEKVKKYMNTPDFSAKVSSLVKQVARVDDKDSRFLWKINGLSKFLRQAKSGERVQSLVTGDPFYTRTYGYKLEVNIFPNGFQIKDSGYLAVIIFIMKGEYDTILPWPFPRHKVTYTLIDQQDDPKERKNIEVTDTTDPDSNSLSARPMPEEHLLCWTERLVSHDQLKTRRYIVDDAIFLQVQVVLNE